MNASELLNRISIHGYAAQIISIKHLPEMESTLNDLKSQGYISPQFYQDELTRYISFDYKSIFPDAMSVIVMAAPQMPTRVYFGRYPVVIPPTYIYQEIWQGTLKALTEILLPHGYNIARARLPLKMLAVKSGLGLYGRNNICYVSSMGSYHRLGAFYSDVPCDIDNWQEAKIMKACQKCRLCLENCPTKCIKNERIIIDAENCLAYFNEGGKAFPDRIDSYWHNAVIGCMICQKVCPANKNVVHKINEATFSFSDFETEEILSHVPLNELDLETQNKINQLGMDDYYNILPRNLAVLGVKPR
jgi:epoxyqueuosine reductase